MNLRHVFLLTLALFFIAHLSSDAQLEANNWYFSGRCVLFFDSDPPRGSHESELVRAEGSASYSDPRTGALLFYTDGLNFWDSGHTLMPGNSSLTGGISPHRHYTSHTTQAALVVPRPGDPHKYYVFNPGNRIQLREESDLKKFLQSMSYSLIDMNVRGGKGDIVAWRSLDYPQRMSTRLTGTKACSFDGFWIVGRPPATNEFFVYRVDADGVAAPKISRTGPLVATEGFGLGQMKISPNGAYLALVSTEAHQPNVIICRFDVKTGEVTDGFALPVEGGSALYGLSFARNSRLLYVMDSNGLIARIEIQHSDEELKAETIASRRVDHRCAGFRQMQLGPDGRIYIGARSEACIMRILNSDEGSDTIAIESFLPIVHGSNKHNSKTGGLPNFMDYIFVMDRDTVCQGGSILFREQRPDESAQWHWRFEGGLPSEWDGFEPPAVRYDRPGEFSVTLTQSSAAGSDCKLKQISVLALPPLDAGRDRSICPGGKQRLRAIGSGTFHWEPAAGLNNVNIADPIAAPQRTTEYVVTLRDEKGCESRDTVVVNVHRIALRVSDTQTICGSGSVQLEADGALSYKWSPAEGLSNPTAANPVASPQRSTLYTVTAFNEFRCSTTATVMVEVFPEPRADAGLDTSICAGDAVRLSGSGGARYQWSPAEGLSDPTSSTPVARPRRSTRYTLTVFNGPDCSSSASVLVTVRDLPQLTVNGEQRICPGDSARLSAAGGIRYEWEPREGLNNPSIPNPKAAPARSTLYRVTVFDAAGCSTSGTVRVLVGNFAIGGVRSSRESICAGESIQLEGYGGDSYEWTPAEGLSATNIPNPIAAPLRSQRYTLRIRRGECEADYSVDVKVETLPALTISPDRRICAGESLRLHAGGGTRYEWSPTHGLSDPTSASPTAAPKETTMYTVRSLNAAGCVSSATLRLEVRPWAVAILGLPDAAVTPGEETILPLELHVPEAYLPLRIDHFRLDIRYDARLVALRAIEDSDLLNRRLDGDEEVLSLEGRSIIVRESRTTLLGLRLMGLIALSSAGDLAIENLQMDFEPGACLTVEQRNGTFAIHEFCLADGLRFAAPLQLQVQPNPARGDIDIELQSLPLGPLRLSLFDAFGRECWRHAEQSNTQALRGFRIAEGAIAAGVYMLLVETAGTQALHKLIILR